MLSLVPIQDLHGFERCHYSLRVQVWIRASFEPVNVEYNVERGV